MPQFTCLFCKKIILTTPFWAKRRKYCSHICYSTSKKGQSSFMGKKHRPDSLLKMRLAKLGKPSARKNYIVSELGKLL